jgi:hypothetical protein
MVASYHPREWKRGTMARISFCPSCGEAVRPGSRFCAVCGIPLHAPPAVRDVEQPKATGFAVASGVCAVISLFFIPLLFGLLGILFGYFAYRRDPDLGKKCMIGSGIALVVGGILGVMVWSCAPV